MGALLRSHLDRGQTLVEKILPRSGELGLGRMVKDIKSATSAFGLSDTSSSRILNVECLFSHHSHYRIEYKIGLGQIHDCMPAEEMSHHEVFALSIQPMVLQCICHFCTSCLGFPAIHGHHHHHQHHCHNYSDSHIRHVFRVVRVEHELRVSLL